MIAAHRHPHPLADNDVSIDHYRLGLDSANGEYRRFRRIDDRGEFNDVEHSEIRYGEGPAGVLLRPIADTVIVVPPLTVTAGEIERIVDVLAGGIRAALG